MKKVLFTILAAGMVLGLSGMAMAVQGTAEVTATVADYAEVVPPADFGLTVNYADGVYSGTSTAQNFTVKSNCNGTITAEVENLSKAGNTATLAATATLGSGSFTGADDHANTVMVSATSGAAAIKDYAAGDYTGTLTITVSGLTH